MKRLFLLIVILGLWLGWGKVEAQVCTGDAECCCISPVTNECDGLTWPATCGGAACTAQPCGAGAASGSCWWTASGPTPTPGGGGGGPARCFPGETPLYYEPPVYRCAIPNDCINGLDGWTGGEWGSPVPDPEGECSGSSAMCHVGYCAPACASACGNVTNGCGYETFGCPGSCASNTGACYWPGRVTG